MDSNSEEDILFRRQRILEEAATLDPRTFQRNTLARQGRFAEACAQNWSAGDIESDDDEIPVLDPVMQSAIAKDDIVVLSDGNCYSKSSIANLVDRGVVTLDTGRAKLPLTNTEMTDLDYALVDRDWLAAAAAGGDRTGDVIADTYAARSDQQQENRELHMRRRRKFEEWRAGRAPLSLYVLAPIGEDANFSPSLWARAIQQFWSNPQAYERDISGVEVWSEVVGGWEPDRRLQMFPFYVDEVLKTVNTSGSNQRAAHERLAEDYAFEVFDPLDSSAVDFGEQLQWVSAWPTVAIERANPGLYEAFVDAVVSFIDHWKVVRDDNSMGRLKLAILEELRKVVRERAPTREQWQQAAARFDVLTHRVTSRV